jgi:hypothetical protein
MTKVQSTINLARPFSPGITQSWGPHIYCYVGSVRSIL